MQAFEYAVELNFVFEDGRGVAVGLDASAFVETDGLITDARHFVLEVRNTEGEDVALDGG